ncbi:unnamed protein product, partial [Polarella glacialis]
APCLHCRKDGLPTRMLRAGRTTRTLRPVRPVGSLRSLPRLPFQMAGQHTRMQRVGLSTRTASQAKRVGSPPLQLLPQPLLRSVCGRWTSRIRWAPRAASISSRAKLRCWTET